jgi:hypothetical protein
MRVVPSWGATARALVIGILIPMFSAIIPIRRALSNNLNEGLNISRSQNSGVLISFIDNSKRNILPYLLVGTIAILFGISVYYLLPKALISLNASLLLNVFFIILLLYLFGLTLLANNFQGLLEIFFMYLFLFWEKPSMITLLKKNLGAHKARNKLTSIIYALSLGSVIFLVTSSNSVIQNTTNYYIVYDTDIEVWWCDSTQIDPILIDYQS